MASIHYRFKSEVSTKVIRITGSTIASAELKKLLLARLLTAASNGRKPLGYDIVLLKPNGEEVDAIINSQATVVMRRTPLETVEKPPGTRTAQWDPAGVEESGRIRQAQEVVCIYIYSPFGSSNILLLN